MKNKKKYGELEVNQFDINNPQNFWPNTHKKNYKINIKLPEFMCRCPMSGYFDFATIYIQYIPNSLVIELKALKLYINSFASKYISHENSSNEIYDTIYEKLQPKKLKLTAVFNPRGNVSTKIVIDSEDI
ncbi:MAG: NADPH-dependent 7-cyano-7-deazaguanine reductase QueF [Epsilonproteobacteria bacterium]|nr:MAG: NADPH-dependent 7-cyano-7-deazaguanine reductase QueF [Campylobacterota bacterium]